MTRTLALCLLFVAAAAATMTAYAEPTPLERAAVPAWHRPWPCCVKIEAEAFVRAGPVRGFLQTPNGGQPGTTSPRRPSLSETGADGAGEAGLRIRAIYRRSELFLEGSGLSFGGDDLLGQDLVSQGSDFPAGTFVDSRSGLSLFRLGYRYRFDVRTGSRGGLQIRPGIGVTGLGVGYRLDGANGARADRSYFHMAPHIDLALEWRPCVTSRWWLSGSVGQTLTCLLPDSNQMNMFDANLRVNFDFARRWTAFLETGYRYIDWRDDQTVQNHIHVEYGPFIGAGLGFRF